MCLSSHVTQEETTNWPLLLKKEKERYFNSHLELQNTINKLEHLLFKTFQQRLQFLNQLFILGTQKKNIM
jgi:hypothetical protein